jgi:hypothetical protein
MGRLFAGAWVLHRSTNQCVPPASNGWVRSQAIVHVRSSARALLALTMAATSVGPLWAAASSVDISRVFAQHVHLGKAGGDRVSSPEALLSALRDIGAVGQSTTDRADFSDYYKASAKTVFLGADVLVVRHEQRRSGDVGCCENPGIALVLRLPRSDSSVFRKFAARNACGFEPGYDMLKELPFLGYVSAFPGGRYALLRCDEWTLRDCQEQARYQ